MLRTGAEQPVCSEEAPVMGVERGAASGGSHGYSTDRVV